MQKKGSPFACKTQVFIIALLCKNPLNKINFSLMNPTQELSAKPTLGPTNELPSTSMNNPIEESTLNLTNITVEEPINEPTLSSTQNDSFMYRFLKASGNIFHIFINGLSSFRYSISKVL